MRYSNRHQNLQETVTTIAQSRHSERVDEQVIVENALRLIAEAYSVGCIPLGGSTAIQRLEWGTEEDVCQGNLPSNHILGPFSLLQKAKRDHGILMDLGGADIVQNDGEITELFGCRKEHIFRKRVGIRQHSV